MFKNAGVTGDDENSQSNFIKDFNSTNHKQSIKNLIDEDEITSIYINYPALLLRKKTEMYPNGRTSHKFKN